MINVHQSRLKAGAKLPTTLIAGCFLCFLSPIALLFGFSTKLCFLQRAHKTFKLVSHSRWKTRTWMPLVAKKAGGISCRNLVSRLFWLIRRNLLNFPSMVAGSRTLCVLAWHLRRKISAPCLMISWWRLPPWSNPSTWCCRKPQKPMLSSLQVVAVSSSFKCTCPNREHTDIGDRQHCQDVYRVPRRKRIETKRNRLLLIFSL